MGKKTLTRQGIKREPSMGDHQLPHPARYDDLLRLFDPDAGSQYFVIGRRPIIARHDDGSRCPAHIGQDLGSIASEPSTSVCLAHAVPNQAEASHDRRSGGMDGGCHVEGILKRLADPATVYTGNLLHSKPVNDGFCRGIAERCAGCVALIVCLHGPRDTKGWAHGGEGEDHGGKDTHLESGVGG